MFISFTKTELTFSALVLIININYSYYSLKTYKLISVPSVHAQMVLQFFACLAQKINEYFLLASLKSLLI
jgi:hypothetical protein